MLRISVRELSGELLHSAARDNQILGITVSNALAGVLVPVDHAMLARLRTAEPPAAGDRTRRPEPDPLRGTGTTELDELLSAPAAGPAGRRLSRVSIRELSGARLTQAADAAEPLVITSDRISVAVFLPVETTWTERLVEESVERLLAGTAAPRSDAGTAVSAPPVSGERFRRQRAIGVRVIPDATDDNTKLVGVVTDVLAKPVGTTIRLPLESRDETYVVGRILELVGRLRARLGPDEELLGVGVEVGGHIRNRRVINSRNTEWDHFALAELLSAHLDVDVVLENDANALAIYEHDYSANGVDSENFAVVLVTHLGIGCALMLDGRLYRGAGGMAGELGHSPVWQGREPRSSRSGPDLGFEPPCRCGRRYCVEAIATPHGITVALAANGIHVDFATALERAPADPRVAQVFHEAGTVLGNGIATLINLLNPEDIVFYGPFELLGEVRSFHIDRDRAKTGTDDFEDRGLTAGSIYTRAMKLAIVENTFSDGAAKCQYFFRKRDNEQGAVAAAASLLKTLRSPTARRARSYAQD